MGGIMDTIECPLCSKVIKKQGIRDHANAVHLIYVKNKGWKEVLNILIKHSTKFGGI